MILVISGAMKYTHSQLICLSMFLLNVTSKLFLEYVFFFFFSQDRVSLSDCILQAGFELTICL